MRPIPVPDDWTWPGSVRQVLAAPDGDLTNDEIAPVEMVVDQATVGATPVFRYSSLIQLDPGDAEKLEKTGGRFWVVFYGSVPPFDVGFPEIMDMLDPDHEGGDVTGDQAQ